MQADPDLTMTPAGTVLLDEWQLLPQVWDRVRRQVDDGAPPGRFLLTGSATPRPGVTTHSGAGRIISLRMRPMALHERGITTPTVSVRSLLGGVEIAVTGTSQLGLLDYIDAMTASGFSGIKASPGPLRTAQLDAYLRRVIDRDIPEQGLAVRRPETLRRWLAAYAAATSSTTPYSRILDMSTAGDGSQPAKTTTLAYRDYRTQLWLLDPVPGWSHSRSVFTRLQHAPSISSRTPLSRRGCST